MEKYEGTLIFEGKDRFGPVEVVDNPPLRTMHFGSPTIQSSMYLDDNFALEMEYNRIMMLSLVFNPSPDSALFLGLGGGAKAKFLWKYFSNCTIEAVELSPMVIRICHRYFKVPKDSNRFIVYRDEAMHFLRSVNEEEYNLIFVDICDSAGMSKVVAKDNFFQRSFKALQPEGVLIWNLWRTSPAHIFKEAMNNFEKAFGTNALYLPNEESLNFVVMAFKQPLRPYTLEEIVSNAQTLKKHTGLDFPKMLSDLKYFKGHGGLFQEWNANIKDEG